MRLRSIILSIIITLSASSTALASWDWLKKTIKEVTDDPVNAISNTSLSETEIGEGLKEALKVGINNAVTSVSKTGGYFDNENIRIPLPEKLQFLDSGLRRLGMGDKIDDFVLSMNQAAESAAPVARDIFLDALFDMNIEDARKIFLAKDTAATDYFKEKTYDQLTAAFKPTINKALAQYDVTDKYNVLIEKYQAIPFASQVNILSPDDYVIEKALEGLFFVVGEEETRIRQDPLARTTELLQKVFKNK